MKFSVKIAIHLFIMQCFWSVQSQSKIEPLSCKVVYCQKIDQE